MAAVLKIQADKKQAICEGAWVMGKLNEVEMSLAKIAWPQPISELIIDASNISQLDTAGAWLLHKIVFSCKQHDISYKMIGLSSSFLPLFKLITSKSENVVIPIPPKKLGCFAKIGYSTVTALNHSLVFIAFIGEIFLSTFYCLFHPQRIRWSALIYTIEHSGYRAIPIIALLSFLIGMVLVYQMGLQLNNYGAGVFATDLLGQSLLREFAPLLTAIIIAGRTGSAYAAQIATMKVNEEIDALQLFGLSPTYLLLLPRLFALLISLPLLTVVANIFGIMGGMLVSKNMLGIDYVSFLTRFQQVIPLKTYLLGLVKTPFFAAIIAIIGCYQGLQVSGSAESVGQRTTVSVVQSIFFIIVADAFASVIYSWYGL